MNRKVHVIFEYYKIHQTDLCFTFENTLISFLEQVQNDNIDNKKVLRYERNEKEVIIIFAKIRMNNIPDKINVSTGECSPIELCEDEGLGEKVVFIFNKDLNVVAIQKNINSISPVGIFNFIKKVVPSSSFDFSFVIRQDALLQYDKMKQIKRAKIKIDCSKDLSCLKGKEDSLFTKIAMQKVIDSSFVEITFSMGVNSNESVSSLITSKFRDIASSLNKSSICSMTVAGLDDEGNSQTLDLLNYKLSDNQEIEIIKRNIDDATLIRCAKNAISNNINVLTGL
nr:MAG TPA: hypothetical protein [Caudoviricetes sp.]